MTTLRAALAAGPVTVRWLRHGEAPEDGETVEGTEGHHSAHARLAWRRDNGQEMGNASIHSEAADVVGVVGHATDDGDGAA